MRRTAICLSLAALLVSGAACSQTPEQKEVTVNQTHNTPGKAAGTTTDRQTDPAAATPAVPAASGAAGTVTQQPATAQEPSSAPSEDGATVPAKEDLLHHRFVLMTADGVDYSGKERVPELEFNEGFLITGRWCNRFSGRGELTGDLIKAPQMVATKMLCADDDLNRMENVFGRMLAQGARISLEGDILTLRDENTVLVWRLRDRVQ